MPGMGQDNISLNNPTIVSLFHHHLYVTSIYWIIGIGLVLLLGATLLRRLTVFNLSRGGAIRTTYAHRLANRLWPDMGLRRHLAVPALDAPGTCGRGRQADRGGRALFPAPIDSAQRVAVERPSDLASPRAPHGFRWASGLPSLCRTAPSGAPRPWWRRAGER